MSFQEKAQTLRSHLHLGNVSPSTFIALLVVVSVVLTSCVYGVVQLIGSRAVLIERAGEDDLAETAKVAETAETDGVRLSTEEEVEQIVVHVCGNVVNPGVYSLSAGSRVSDALSLAGGSTEEANLDALNLARILIDGEQVLVPGKQEASSAGSVSASSASSGLSQRVNINTASIDELMTLNNVGEATAKKIVSDREKNGPFATIEDLKRVSGIGDKKFEAIKERICV